MSRHKRGNRTTEVLKLFKHAPEGITAYDAFILYDAMTTGKSTTLYDAQTHCHSRSTTTWYRLYGRHVRAECRLLVKNGHLIRIGRRVVEPRGVRAWIYAITERGTKLLEQVYGTNT